MRLLETETGKFEWFSEPHLVRYAILSHVWSKKTDADYTPEETYADVVKAQSTHPDDTLSHISEKIQNACRVALGDGFRYIWIDTCCIDKSSSAELSKAINSMFNWYRCSKICYAYLDKDFKEPFHPDEILKCVWFRRGWTLQELIASRLVVFISKSWGLLGTKHGLAPYIAKGTGISIEVLRHERQLADVSVAERMYWASTRTTTEMEDEAYCLIGIFGVNMMPIYGEGAHAFARLQRAILEQISDQSIFAWG
ncbi:heterokaryon incompatibility protein-domain-containing protein, partial [Epithele typhae]|uniref:heterokaryon incompatibility protein-domain-containing protein n=1 Tax=Epithele typhae TaxID=378194 RepID=UPI00200787A5